VEKKNIVITGATGLLGSYLLPLLTADNDVWAISQNPPEGDSSVSWIRYDLSGELDGLRDHLPEQIDAVVHLAQSPHFREFPQRAGHVFQVNVASTQFLLQEAAERGCRHFVNASTGGVYDSAATPFVEDDVRVTGKTIGFYPASKQCGELLVNAYGGLFNVVNLRFFFIYGRGQSESMLIPRLVHSVQNGLPITLQGNDGLSLNPVHASDASKAVIAALELEGTHSLNVAGEDVVTLRKVGELIGISLGKTPEFDARQDQQAPSMEADITRMCQCLGRPQKGISEGLADYCNYYLEVKAN